MSYQTSSKRSPPFWLLIGARKTQVFWHQSEARTAATDCNWSGKTLSPGALLAVLYFSSCHIFRPCSLPSPPLPAPGSLRMPLRNTSYKFPRSIEKWPFCIQNSPCLIFFAYSFRWRQTATVLHRGQPYKASNGNHKVPKQSMLQIPGPPGRGNTTGICR